MSHGAGLVDEGGRRGDERIAVLETEMGGGRDGRGLLAEAHPGHERNARLTRPDRCSTPTRSDRHRSRGDRCARPAFPQRCTADSEEADLHGWHESFAFEYVGDDLSRAVGTERGDP